ncbi:hypothetical protein DL93DRAFT_401825 [Clavulina sp. PMI_390]|nr:hypothetical protein DL93DRAFT_401825 [Clavulina sp. PMI_390]
MCSSSAPCCSEYGYCGTGPGYCLGGCQPAASYSWSSCEPTPICKNATYTFQDDTRLVNYTQYDGNATKWDFTIDHGDIYNLNDTAGELALLLTETNGGTRLSSTRYMWYGSVTAKLKATKWAGVVTAFITMSDVKDEIDWEWPGANTTTAQSNFFWLGKVNYPPTNGQVDTVPNDAYSNYNEYTINWQEDQLTWSIDGNVVRTVKKSDTLVSGVANYPTTPARIQISVWPAGINTSAAGTIEWAGGMINWNDPDYAAAGGHFAAVFESVTVTCANPSNTSLPNNPRSYAYAGLDSNGDPIAYISNATTNINSAYSRVAMSRSTLWATGTAAVGIAIGMVLFV